MKQRKISRLAQPRNLLKRAGFGLATLSSILVLGISGTASAAAGDIDTTFGNDGYALVSQSTGAFAIQSNNEVVFSTADSNGNWGIARLSTNGNMDTTFGENGIAALPGIDDVIKILVLPNDDILAVTLNSTNDAQVFKLLPNGSADLSFGSGGMADTSQSLSQANDAIHATLDNQGNIDIVGLSISLKQATVIQLSPDGSPNPAFGTNGIATFQIPNAPANAIKNEPLPTAITTTQDGSILIGINGQVLGRTGSPLQQYNTILKYTSDGILDDSFGSGGQASQLNSGFVPTKDSLVVLGNGTFIVGEFSRPSNVNGTATPARSQLWGFNQDGSVNQNFGVNGVATVSIDDTGGVVELRSIAVDRAGDIILGGQGDEATLERFTAAGTPDLAFGQDGSVELNVGLSFQSLAIDSSDNVLADAIQGNADAPDVNDIYIARVLGTPEEGFVSAPTSLTTSTPTNQHPSLSWDAVSAAASYNIYRDGGELIGSTTVPSFVDSTAAQGAHDYYVTAVDGSGNESLPSNTVSVTYDTTGPVIGFASPTVNSYVSGTVTVSGTITDNLSGIQNNQVVVHVRPINADTGHLGGFLDTLYAPVDTNGNWSITFDSTAFADGNYGVTALANDNAGNSQTASGGASLKPFFIDNSKPTVSLSSLNSTYVTGPTVTITASDDNGLSALAIHVYNTSNQLQTVGCNANSAELAAGSLTCDLSGLAPGTYYVRAGATDTGGKNSTVNTAEFVITG